MIRKEARVGPAHFGHDLEYEVGGEAREGRLEVKEDDRWGGGGGQVKGGRAGVQLNNVLDARAPT